MYWINKRILTGVGLSRGLSHGEYIISNGQVYLIEIAARGGGVYISSDIIPLMTGFDTTSFIIDIATQRKVERPVITNTGKVVCYVAFFLPEGVVQTVQGVDEVTSKQYVHHNNLSSIRVGMETKKNTDKTSRFFMVLEADSYLQMKERIEAIKNLLEITVLSLGGEYSGIIWN